MSEQPIVNIPVTVEGARIIQAGLAELPLKSAYHLFNHVDSIINGQVILHSPEESAETEYEQDSASEE